MPKGNEKRYFVRFNLGGGLFPLHPFFFLTTFVNIRICSNRGRGICARARNAQIFGFCWVFCTYKISFFVRCFVGTNFRAFLFWGVVAFLAFSPLGARLLSFFADFGVPDHTLLLQAVFGNFNYAFLGKLN